MEYLKEFLKKRITLTKGSWTKLQKISDIIDISKKTILCDFGTIPTSFYFLKKGVVRAYITLPNKQEYNKAIFTENTFFGALSGLIRGDQTQIVYETLTDCKLIEINFAGFMKLVETKNDINKLYRKVLEEIFLKLEIRDIEMVTLNATERYIKLKNNTPEIDHLISQYHIASNLGITPIQLSRIRKKMSTKVTSSKEK